MTTCNEALHELVCFGSVLLGWHLEELKGSEEHLVPSMFFKRILEIVDAISIQISKSIINPCDIHLRSLLETGLAFEYLLESDIEERMLHYLVVDELRHSEELKYSLNRMNELLVKQNKRIINIDEVEELIELNNVNLQNKINHITNWLAKPKQQVIVATYYARTTNRIKLDFKWYSLSNKTLSNLRELSKFLNKEEYYITLYKYWSNPTHGTDLIGNSLVIENNDLTGIVGIRDPRKVKEVSIATANLCLESFKQFLKLIPKQHFGDIKWWEQMYRHSYLNGLYKIKVEF